MLSHSESDKATLFARVAPLENFELVPLLNGLTSLRCLEPRETFHPGIGPASEAQILHVDQQEIVARCLKAKEEFHLWDVGLGAAANVLMAIKSLEQLELPHPVAIHSFDKTTSPIKFALEHATELQYLLGYENQINTLLEEGTVKINEKITWNLHGEFTKIISQSENKAAASKLRAPDAIFYDPYSAIGNPEMWSLDNFTNLFAQLDPKRMCLLSNYTASTYIRVTLLLSGFYVGIGCGIDKKVQTTIASNQFEALDQPFDLKWLEKRVRISHSAAPIRSIPHEIAPLSEEDYLTLLRHPQFAI